jgi:hypothetical protein
VKFIHEYQNSKELPEDQCAWHLHPIVVKKQVNFEDCGVCLSLAIYCLVHGLDYHTMPPVLFSNKAYLFIFYIVMGFQIEQDDTYDCLLDEDRGTITSVNDKSPGVE